VAKYLFEIIIGAHIVILVILISFGIIEMEQIIERAIRVFSF
jgi:hypothetical protein